MRKIIFVLLLTIVSSVQMMSEELLFTYDTTDIRYCGDVVTGVLKKVEHPKLFHYYPSKQTIMLDAGGKIYYLCFADSLLLPQLEALDNHVYEVADIRGDYYVRMAYDYNFNVIGKYNFLRVCSISMDSARLPSLCDEWNVLSTSYATGQPVSKTIKHRLTTDTIIGRRRYRKHVCDDKGYLGAMREGDNREIYYYPKGDHMEYIIYAFNSPIGCNLPTFWYGEQSIVALVKNISEGSPRIFTIEPHFRWGNDTLYWIEGVGYPDGPTGGMWPKPDCENCSSHLLCAYKEGELVYTSFLGEIIGCEYSGPGPFISTVPLFVKDGPGTSTVDPIDPNLIVAYLQNNLLIIKEFVGVEFYYALTNGLNPLMQARGMAPQQQSFRKEVVIPLTEPGVYTIELTSPEWDYSVTGTFTYMPQGIETVSGQETVAPVKILQNGQLFIIRSGKTFTLTGQEMK